MKPNVFFLAILAFLGFSRSYGQTATTVNVSATSSVNTISNNVATVVDPGFTITSNGTISGFIVSITDSYTSGDLLAYSGALPSGVSAAAFNVDTRSLVFTGITSAENWQALLRTVTLRTTSAACFPEKRKVSFTVGNKYYNPLTGHFYEYYSSTPALNWKNAKTNAATQSYFGRAGYLATITSAAENNFIWKIMKADTWVGATYDHTELTGAGITTYADQAAAIGKVYWITGPERGTFISSGLTTPQSQNGQYMNWSASEPNNWSGTNEFYTQLYSLTNGLWNDLPITSLLNSVIEYGGMPNDAATSTVVATREMYVNGAPSGTITGGDVSVCAGTNSTTLTISGFNGTVVRWEYSYDNFLTAGVAISSSASPSYTATNLNQTTYYRAIVNTTSPANCTNLTASSTAILVTPTIAGNAFAENTTICPGGQAKLTLFGNSGNILKWQVSTSSTFASDVTDISNTTANLSHTLSSTGTYYFRAQVQNNGCGSPVFTPASPVTVSSGTPPVGGTVSNADHCSGSNAGTLTLSGHTGNVQKWQYSVDGGVIWTDVANTTASLSYTGVTSTRLYRAVVANGSCGTASSQAGTVLVYGNTQYEWLGQTNAVSATNSNWRCSTIPPSGADVIISNTAANDLVLSQSYVFGSVDFSGSNRKIILGNYDLTVSALIGANANNYVVTNGTGRLIIAVPAGASRTFAAGNSAYNPVTITNNTGSADIFSVKVLDEVYANGSNGSVMASPRVRRTWDINKANANTGSGVSFEFAWNNGETTGAPASPALYHYESGTWLRQTGSTSSGGNSLTYTGYTGTFSPFAIGDNMVLPVSWLSFQARKQGTEVMVSWSTAAEHAARDYVVQHSTDGISWSDAGTVAAAGNSTTTQQYQFLHRSPAKGINYYRIWQRDADGRSDYSSIATVTMDQAQQALKVHPNPVFSGGQLNLLLQKDVTVSIYDNKGNKVWQKDLQAGQRRIPTTGFARGVYYIQAGTELAMVIVK